MLQAFDIIARDHPVARLARVLAAIRTDVEAGLPLSAALRRHPQAFDALYADVVAAGELAGTLDTLLDRLASHLEKTEALKSRLRAALMYPAAVLAVALAVVAVIMAVVVPAFQDLFAAFGAELPVPTQAVIALSTWLVTHGWLMLALLVASAIAAWQAVRRSPRLRAALEHLLLRLPLAGALLRQSAVTRWTRTLATLFAAGVPLVEALACVGSACGNGRYHAATLRIRQDVAAGSSLSHAMAATRLFSPMALQMAAVGEESGALDRMLAKAADWHEAEVDSRIAGLASLVEPVLVVVLGLLVGGIVVAMYLPVFQLGQVV
ncbi:MAG: putative type II secretion system protein F [Paracidovorax wautersii]|uniref:Putative type II secretion system protein F n=1 Tax=Paracidovorax wautersii TaxID=1177982 RepID=A0A7V8FQC4_9BURK|nr:MAG: putative type II secretion system protein F [Paracidovorax wautersii]